MELSMNRVEKMSSILVTCTCFSFLRHVLLFCILRLKKKKIHFQRIEFK